jgi:parvulin-like peptidyl-prolyl isomerase
VNAEVDVVKKAPSVGALDDARDKAEAIRARVLKGESFDKLAAELSDAPSKANGGLIGPVSREEMNEELLKLLSKMKSGEMTPVLNTPTGAQLFKLESSIDSTTLPFEAARAQVAERLGQQKVGAEFRKYVQRLRAQAIIEWKNDDLRKAWDAGVSAEPTY